MKTKDRHTREYYINYARNHPFWCKAHWYLSKSELELLRKDKSEKIENNIYINFNI